MAAVALDTGEDVVFDSALTRPGPEHARTSAALMPAFPPIDTDGRPHVGAALSANLPLDSVLADPGPDRLVVIALDLLPPSSPTPRSSGEAAGRLQNLIFATQTRRAIDA